MSDARDRFVYDRLPPQAQWPDILALPGVPQTGELNCVDELLEQHVQSVQGQRTALIGPNEQWSCLLYTSPSPRDS